MRMTIRITTCGARWMARFPMAEKAPVDMCGADGRIDKSQVREFFRRGEGEGALCSGDDDNGVLCAAYEFLWQLHGCVKSLSENEESDCTMEAVTAIDRSLDRKMTKDAVSFVRMDIMRRRADGAIRVRVGASNPRGLVGPCLRSARSFAVDVIRIWKHIGKAVSDGTKGKVRFEIEERDDAESRGLIAEAAEKDRMQEAEARRRELEAMREKCERRKPSGWTDYCSPSKFDCPCYSGGKCVMPGDKEEKK